MNTDGVIHLSLVMVLISIIIFKSCEMIEKQYITNSVKEISLILDLTFLRRKKVYA